MEQGVWRKPHPHIPVSLGVVYPPPLVLLKGDGGIVGKSTFEGAQFLFFVLFFLKSTINSSSF